MKLDEIIKSCGEQIEWQLLHECLISSNIGKKHTAITFGTTRENGFQLLKEKQDKVCVICWIPRDKMP